MRLALAQIYAAAHSNAGDLDTARYELGRPHGVAFRASIAKNSTPQNGTRSITAKNAGEQGRTTKSVRATEILC